MSDSTARLPIVRRGHPYDCNASNSRNTLMENRSQEVQEKQVKRVRARVFMRNAETKSVRYLLWVELRGHDFYWGTPDKAPDIPSTRLVPGQSISITVPHNYASLPKASFKTSFHASGVTHVTSDGSGVLESQDTYVGPVTSFTRPTMFAAMLTAVPSATPNHTKRLGRGGDAAKVLEVEDKYWDCRWYFDFSVTPAGTFELPPAVMMPDGYLPPVLDTPFLSEELDLIMVIRGTPVGDQTNSWQPDKTLIALVTPPERG